MSMEEDTELRDLISQTLEANGCFAKIRAQLRASIYLALDEDDVKKELFPNKKLNSILETVEGKIMFCVVREFLEHFDLNFTISVFEPETFMGSNYEYMGKYKLIEDLKLPYLEQESSDPVLFQLIQLCKLSNKMNDSKHSVSSSCKSESSQNICEENSSNSSSFNDDTLIKSISNNSIPDNVLNKTFDVNVKGIPVVNNILNVKNDLQNDHGSNILVDEDLNVSKFYLNEGATEKSLIDFDKSVKVQNMNNKSDTEKCKSLIDQTIIDTDFSPPVVKDCKHSKFDTSFDKVKLSSPKSDKIKVKNNLSSLSDLPPLQISKSRSNDMLLPSLYTKEFKEKGNVKDIEKLFELEPLDNYEEDFISETEIDLTISKHDEIAKNSALNIPENIDNKNGNVSNAIISRDHTSPVNELELNNKKVYIDNSTSSSVTSEDFELNSNIDDILNSC